MGRWLGVTVAIYLFIGSAFGSIAWARSFGGGATQMGWGPKPRQVDSVKVGQDEEKLRQDLSQIAQHKQDFQKQFLGLKTQRAEALKSKNKDQAKALTLQMQQLRQQHRAQNREARMQLSQDRRLLRKDQRGEPKQESGRKHHSKHLHVEGSQ
ncbi:MAG: hypothetical protein HY211_07745 [Candidatus Omnitrophica bacterium]|nr:hypothetical protein [Candidatus Omnitrophota bacterium]